MWEWSDVGIFYLPWDDISSGVLGGTSLNRFHTSTKQRRGLRISPLLFEDQCSHWRVRLLLQVPYLLQHRLHGIHMAGSTESLPSQLQCYAQTVHTGKRDQSCLQNQTRALGQSVLLGDYLPLRKEVRSLLRLKWNTHYTKSNREVMHMNKWSRIIYKTKRKPYSSQDLQHNQKCRWSSFHQKGVHSFQVKLAYIHGTCAHSTVNNLKQMKQNSAQLNKMSH